MILLGHFVIPNIVWKTVLVFWETERLNLRTYEYYQADCPIRGYLSNGAVYHPESVVI